MLISRKPFSPQASGTTSFEASSLKMSCPTSPCVSASIALSIWTSMRLTGPVDSPNEDLSERLIVAAGGAVIDKVESTTRDVLNLGRDAAKGALDFILPKGK